MRVRKNSRLIDNVFMYNKPYLTSCLVIKSSLELLPLLFLPIYPFLSLFRSEATSTYYFVRLPGRPYVCLIWQLPRWPLPLLLGALVSSHIVGLPFDHLLFQPSHLSHFILHIPTIILFIIIHTSRFPKPKSRNSGVLSSGRDVLGSSPACPVCKSWNVATNSFPDDLKPKNTFDIYYY